MKFFRTMRSDTLKSKNTRDYLIYAIGETLLVVIGILLALQINNWNQQTKNQEKINSIYQEILNDLSDDIPEINHIIKFYQKKDTLTQLVLENKITAKDYERRNSYRTLILNRRTLKINSNGYEVLTLHIDKIPEEQTALVTQLKKLYNADRNRVEEFQQKTSEIIDETLTNYARRYDWYSMTEDSHESEWIKYQLTDPKYKNEVRLYEIIAVRNLLPILKGFRMDAIKAYHLLHKTIDSKEELPEFVLEIL